MIQQFRFSVIIASAALFLLFFTACKHDPLFDPPLIVSSTCSPDTVYFQNQVLPILVSNCTKSGCHSAADHRSGVILDSYQSLLNTIESPTNTNWSNNGLMEVIQASNGGRMPPPPDQALTQEQINIIGTWINQGAKNNICNENAGPCDSTANTYTLFVKPLMQSKCVGCHSGTKPQGNISLSTYANTKTLALNGKLYASVIRTAAWMPSGGAQLDACTLAKLKAWIDMGAPEN